MNWSEVTLYTSNDGIEPVCAILMDLGISSFVVENPAEIEQFIHDNSGTWDMVDEDVLHFNEITPNVKFYLADDAQSKETLCALQVRLEQMRDADEKQQYGTLTLSIAYVKDEDWENNWKQYFKPFPIGERFLIKPTWETTENPEGRIILEIDPGTSFGSGLHETTRLCIQALEQYVDKNSEVIDVGCGSGILSVAAALLGCKHTTGIDIDQAAVDTASECARINHVAKTTTFLQGNLLSDLPASAQCNIIVGNLFANIIKHLLPQAKKFLEPNGILITSGIISDTVDEVEDAYQTNGFQIIEKQNIGDWYLLIGQTSITN
jgi:ribosomal protein L11 methyltransferase